MWNEELKMKDFIQLKLYEQYLCERSMQTKFLMHSFSYYFAAKTSFWKLRHDDSLQLTKAKDAAKRKISQMSS